jgi:hypothetical protein
MDNNLIPDFSQFNEMPTSPIMEIISKYGFIILKYGLIILAAAAFIRFMISPLLNRGEVTKNLSFLQRLILIITEWAKGVLAAISSFIENLKDNINKAVKILDSITIDNDLIKINLRFMIKDDQEASVKCRELAYQNGYEKAMRYAELAGLKIIKAVRISECQMPGTDYSNNDTRACKIFIGESPTSLPMGKVERSMSLYIDFIAE